MAVRGSIDDWAAKAAEKIFEEARGPRTSKPTVERIAAIIAWYAKPLEDLVRASRREHDEGSSCDAAFNEDTNLDYECTCGADEWNAKVNGVLNGR